MRRFVWLLVLLGATLAGFGCSGDKERGLYRNQDKPQEPAQKDK